MQDSGCKIHASPHASSNWYPGCRISHLASRIPHPASCILHPASRILHPASCIPHPVSRIHLPWSHFFVAPRAQGVDTLAFALKATEPDLEWPGLAAPLAVPGQMPWLAIGDAVDHLNH